VAVTWGAPQGDTLNNEKDVEYSAALHLCTGSVENIKKGWFDGYGAFRRRVRGSFNKIMTSSGGVHGFRQVGQYPVPNTQMRN
jgi:hypothetical protein